MTGGPQQVGVDREPAGTSATQQVERGVRRAAVGPRLSPLLTDRVEHPPERRARLGRLHRPVSTEARGGRDPTGQHARQRRLVELHHPPVDARQPPAQVGEVASYALREGLRELAAGAVVGEDPVAAWSLDGRGEGPGAHQLGLERSLVALRLLLDLVEVLAQQAGGPALVAARAVGQPPAGGLEVEGEVGDERDRPAGHGRAGAAARQLGDVGKAAGRRQLAEHDPHRLGVGPRVVAGMGADAGGGRHRCPAPTRPVALMVAEPTTRVPS